MTPRIVSNSNTAAVSGLNPDAKREDLKGPDQAETDRPPDATVRTTCMLTGHAPATLAKFSAQPSSCGNKAMFLGLPS